MAFYIHLFLYASPIPFIVSLLYILCVSCKERGNAWDYVTNFPNEVSLNKNTPMSLYTLVHHLTDAELVLLLM